MLMNLHVLTAAALAGADLAADDRNNVSSRPRVMRGVGLTGSVAVNDFWVDVFIGNTFVGRFRNTKAGAVQITQDQDMVRFPPLYVAPGDKVSVIAGVNAGAGNVNCMIA